MLNSFNRRGVVEYAEHYRSLENRSSQFPFRIIVRLYLTPIYLQIYGLVMSWSKFDMENPSYLLYSSMCRAVECAYCNRPIWYGSGKHIESALKDVPNGDRCPGWQKGTCVLAPKGTPPSHAELHYPF